MSVAPSMKRFWSFWRPSVTYFWICSNVQNFLCFWYNIEFWTRNLIMEKTCRVNRRITEKKNVQMQFRMPCITSNVTGRGTAILQYVLVVARLFVCCRCLYCCNQSFKVHGPIWSVLKFYAELGNFGRLVLSDSARPKYDNFTAQEIMKV